MENQIIKLTGVSYYSKTKTPATKGKYPTHCYEVGITNFSDKEIDGTFLQDFVKTDKNDTEVKFIKVQNSKYPFKIYDQNNTEILEKISIPNGTKICIAFAKKYTEEYKKDYLCVVGIKLLEEIKIFNPFED